LKQMQLIFTRQCFCCLVGLLLLIQTVVDSYVEFTLRSP